MDIKIHSSKVTLGTRAAAWCAGYINQTVTEKGKARMILATGASQFEFLDALVKLPVKWDKVICFHLDEYVGLPIQHHASFRNYLKTRVWDRINPPMQTVHMLDPDKIEQYEKLLAEDEIHLACIGIGENGHIAFNDPPVADFDDPKLVKIVELDEACRKQQIGEGWFKSMSDTPTHAASLTIPAIMRAKAISVVVPDERKAKAVHDTLLGPINTKCPATILRHHDNCTLWLDEMSSSRYTAQKKLSEKDSNSDFSISIPGLVDLQINGYKGVDFSSLSLTEESFTKACKEIFSTGVALFLPTIITSPLEVYQHVLTLMAKVVNSSEEFRVRIPGIHLEEPFISPKQGARGCHMAEHIMAPDIEVFEKLQKLAQGKIKVLTLASELPGAAELCSYVTGQGVIASLGHQMGGIEPITELQEAGAKMLTHLGNGVESLIHRHDNPIWAGLADDNLVASLITDGHHLPVHVIKVILKVKTSDKIIITSDMSPLAGMPPGEHLFGPGIPVVLNQDGRLSIKDGSALAGSTFTPMQCANFIWQSRLATVEELEKMCFYNPLKLIGMSPEKVKNVVMPLLKLGHTGFECTGCTCI